MTVAAVVPLIEYVENGATLIFAVPFQFRASSELVVSNIDPDTEVETVLVLSVDYTVTGGAGLTGSITKTAAAAAGMILRIKRYTVRSQTTDYITGGKFPAETHEALADKQVAIAQELDEDIAGVDRELQDAKSRALMVPPGETIPWVPDAATRAEHYQAWDENGDPVLGVTRAEVADMRSDINTNASGLADEITNRIEDVDQEETARVDADNALQANINAEAVTRAAADAAEQSARIAIDNVLQGAIDTEEAARDAGDQAVLAAIAAVGGALGTVMLEAATVTLLGGLDTTLGLSAALTEDNRSGMFRQVAYADYSAAIDADTDNLVFKRSTFDVTKAWMRDFPFIMPEHGNVHVGIDATAGLLRMWHVAQLIGRPCFSTGFNTYPIGKSAAVDGGFLRVGSLDGSAVPAAGFLDDFKMLGIWKFRAKAALYSILEFRNGTRLTFGDVDFDILTEATNGHGQLRFQNSTVIRHGDVTKIGNEATMATYGGIGGSAVSLQSGVDDVRGGAVKVEWAGPSSSAVFTVGAGDFWFKEVHCIGGQDAYDVSSTQLTGGKPAKWGADLVYGEKVDEVLDAGNAPGGHIKKLVFKDVADVLNIKTEAKDGAADSVGTNNMTIDTVEGEEWTGLLIGMQAGGTSGLAEAEQQTLHNFHIGRVIARTTTATAATRAFRLVSGDKVIDPTKGFKVGFASIVANDGTTIELGGIIDYVFEDVTSNMPVAMVDNTAAQHTRERFNGRFSRVRLAGNISCFQRGTVWEDVETSGEFRVSEGRHNVYRNAGSRNSQIYGLTLKFTTAGDKNVDVYEGFGINCGIGGVASQYALNIIKDGAAIACTGIRIHSFHMEDNQRSLDFTSGGVVEPVVGQRVVDNVTGAAGFINKITLSGGSWAGADAAGTLLLREVSGEFAAGSMTLRDPDSGAAGGVLSADFATAAGASVVAPTTSGLRLQSNITTDKCTLAGVTNNGVPSANQLDYGFKGASSANDANNLIKDSPVRSRAVNTTLQMIDAGGILQATANLTVTLDGVATVFPIGTEFKVQHRAGASTVDFGVANGAVITSRGGLLDIAQNGEALLRITGTAPMTAQLTGDLT